MSGCHIHHVKLINSNMEALVYLCLLILPIFSNCLGRNAYYRPPNGTKFENCSTDDQLQDCRRSCDESGDKFCSFRGNSEETSYRGCIPSQFANFCCNQPTKNHKDCGKTHHDLTEACDAEKYGEWLFMNNTSGDVTCRHKSEELMGGHTEQYTDYKGINVEHEVCKQPSYWCHGIQNYENITHFSWSCRSQDSKCNKVSEKKNDLVYIITGIVSVIIILFIFIGILIFCKWRRRRKEDKLGQSCAKLRSSWG